MSNSSTMDIDFNQYQLRCQLIGHEDDARGICICGDSGIATSSRDRTVRFWSLDESQKRDFVISKILLGHTSFVGPVAWVEPNEEFPEGGIVSGGMDTLVLVWNLATGEKVQTLRGHTLQVTGITLDGTDIVSTSVDCTIRRWRAGQQVESWEAHKTAIQAILKLPSGEFVTGSSDMTLKLWKGKSCTHTLVGHSDTVRGLAVMPSLGILSASHDGSIRLWALSGEVLLEMVGHTSIVYSVDAHESGLIVSGSEDCSAKIWKDGTCVQTLDHPGCVWDAKFLGNGDIVTACSDGIVRVWTADHGRVADAALLDAFTDQISQYKISRKTMLRERVKRVVLAPAKENIEKIKKVVEDGNSYGAQQMYKSFSARYTSAKRYTEALDILHSGAYEQLENAQVTCGTELAVLFVETLVKGKIPYDDDTLDRIRTIYKKFPRIPVPQHLDLADDDDMQRLSEALGAAKIRMEGCSSFLKAAIRWSIEFGSYKHGSPDLHDMMADYLYSESPELDMTKVTYYFVRGKNPKKFASTLVNFMGKCYPGEDDLAIARAVLMYLSFGNMRDANALMDDIKKQVQISDIEFPDSELMQLINYLLPTLQRDALPLFNILRQRYHQSIGREPIFSEFLDEIAEKFYGVPRRNAMAGGMFGELFKIISGE